MRRLRLIVLIGAVASALLVVAPAASAASPPWPAPGGGTISGPIPQTYSPIDYPAGFTCPFPLHIEFPVSDVVGYTYTDASRRVVAEYFTGPLIARVTRTDTGQTVSANLSGDGLQTFASDGSSVLYGFGPFGSGQHPGDTPGPEYAVLNGFSALRIDANGHKTILFSTRVDNLCLKLG
jgi:hypothetical protein